MPEQIADQLLVMDAQAGCYAALEQLIARWQKPLWGHAFRLTGRSDAAWDISQDSWLDIVRGLARLKEADRFGAWAHRIVRNNASDWVRHHASRVAAEGQAELEARGSTVEPAQFEVAVDVHCILRCLSTPSQDVLSLYYLKGCGLAEIAEALGKPEGTVKSRLHTARAEFRRTWESFSSVHAATRPETRKEPTT
ncbi:sigma-70 family RNA polymerase sigma factor [Opitutus sp. ER46]|uniref:RNA polymerase sigma factor n=1 Tax=Opitutus sp. ER46 TaxID=2161864 RepID=UPI0011B268EA|nr:sigma-70 family RNA polymerase sigma factor [Opitutus sp. ER46]